MKAQIVTTTLVALCTPLLTQCVIEDSPDSYKPSHNTYGNPAKSEHVYEKGLKMGRKDGREGRSRKPSRHAGQYAPAESDAFYSGYEKGYNEGIR